MEKQTLARPLNPRKIDAPIGYDQNNFCRYHNAKWHKTNDCKILDRGIENMIQKGSPKYFGSQKRVQPLTALWQNKTDK